VDVAERKKLEEFYLEGNEDLGFEPMGPKINGARTALFPFFIDGQVVPDILELCVTVNTWRGEFRCRLLMREDDPQDVHAVRRDAWYDQLMKYVPPPRADETDEEQDR